MSVLDSIRVRSGQPLYVCHVAAYLRVPARTVRHWALTGVLHGRRERLKVWVFDPCDVTRFRAQRYERAEQRHV